jgi:hypothetical protein
MTLGTVVVTVEPGVTGPKSGEFGVMKLPAPAPVSKTVSKQPGDPPLTEKQV